MYSPLIQPNLSRSKTTRFFDTWLNSSSSTACYAVEDGHLRRIGPAEERHGVEHGVGQVPGLAIVAERYVAMPLRQLAAVGTEEGGRWA